MDISLDHTKYWVPVYDIAIKPFIIQRFRMLDDVVEFYLCYAFTGGFDVRRSTDSKNR